MCDPKLRFQTASGLLGGWRDDVLSGKPPTFYPIGDGELRRLEIGPGLVTLFGGAPGAGKTGFVMQAVIDALRLTPTLRAVVCNVEMPSTVLLDRQLARLSGIDLTTIRYRRLRKKHATGINFGMTALDGLADRLAFVRPPFDLSNVAAVAKEFDAGLIVLDYIQRIQPPGIHGDSRSSVNAAMNHIRELADAGAAIIVLSAVGRTKDSAGRSSYSGEGMNLASFRESSELEYGADDAFILTPDDKAEGEIILKHLKSRNGECRNLRMRFDKPRQSFTPIDLLQTSGEVETPVETSGTKEGESNE